MAMKKKRPPSSGEQSAANMAMSFGFAIVIPILLCILGGVALDNWLHTTPLFTLVGAALGLAISGFQLWRLAVAAQAESGGDVDNSKTPPK